MPYTPVIPDFFDGGYLVERGPIVRPLFTNWSHSLRDHEQPSTRPTGTRSKFQSIQAPFKVRGRDAARPLWPMPPVIAMVYGSSNILNRYVLLMIMDDAGVLRRCEFLSLGPSPHRSRRKRAYCPLVSTQRRKLNHASRQFNRFTFLPLDPQERKSSAGAGPGLQNSLSRGR